MNEVIKKTYKYIAKDSDTLSVGVDVSVTVLETYDCIVWNNRGLYGVVKEEIIKDMLRHLKNILDHPRTHTGKKSALIFYWEQVQMLSGPPQHNFVLCYNPGDKTIHANSVCMIEHKKKGTL